ncbi:MAG TPA: hypothetical protein DEQ88_05390 [Clostridiales bacterium]|nr:hypothetical protein [Clostridiales bacterium]
MTARGMNTLKKVFQSGALPTMTPTKTGIITIIMRAAAVQMRPI